MKTKTFFKWLCCSAILLIASVQPSMAAWIGNAGIYVNNTWYKASTNIDGGNWLESKDAFNNYDLGAITSLTLGGQYQTYDNNQIDYCGWNSSNGIWITITTNSGTTKVNSYKLSCWHKEKSGNNNVWETFGTTNDCSDDKKTFASYSQSISGWDPGVYKLKVHWFSPSGQRIPSGDDVATFTINPKVTFDKNNGSGSMSAQTVTYNTNTTLNANTFTAPTGYHFNGWNTKSDGSGTSYTNKGTIKTTSNVTLYAQWAETTHTATIAYKCSGESIKTSTTSNPAGIVTYAEITAPEIGGYKFSTWSTLPTGATLKTGDDLSNETINVHLSKDGLTLTANYIVDKTMYTYAFGRVTGMTDAMGTVSSDPSTSPLESGTEITVTASPKTGYEVEGWYSDQAGNNKIVGAGTTNPYVFSIAGNTTVYVKFQETKYTVNVAKGTGVSSVSPVSVQVGQINASGDITATPATGYELDGWTLGTGITIVEGTKSPIKIKATQAGTITAKAKAKTYTISFNQNGGTGGQTATVTATYDQPMPGNVTCPTRVGYKFNGYWDAASNGTKYYNADGTSANNWDKDANTTLYAQWTQMHVYVQGRMHVANKKRSEGGDITWTNSFNGGSSTETSAQWAEACRAIEMQLVTENNRTYYKLVTNATLSDLSTKFSGGDNLWQYFYLRSTSVTTSNGAWDGYIYKQVENGNSFKLADRGEEHARAWSAEGEHRPCFSDDDRSGYVVIYFDETKVWYELEEFTTYDVEFSNGGGGGTVTPSGTKKTGEVSWTVTANPSDGYSFAGWTLTGGAKAKESEKDLKTYYTIHVTATGDGKAIANFKIMPKIYFQTCNGWGEKVYVYFYKGNYWNDTYGAGSQKSGNCISDAIEMKYTGGNNIHYAYYDVESLRDKGMDNHIAFTSGPQTDKQYFYQTNVVWLGNFSPCDNPLFVAEGFDYSKNECGYYKGHWSNMVGDEPEDYLMMQSENWKPNENMRFKKNNDGNWTVIKTYAGTGDAYKDLFKVWRNCDGNWYGYGQKEDGQMSITTDTRNAKIYAGDHNVEIIPWKAGEYEFTWNPNAKEISVIYLGDITVANFPGEVSTFVNRQHKIKPDVTLRNGTKVTDVTITVNGNNLPYETTIATYEQNGTNLIITGKTIGSETVTVTYRNTKTPPYEVERTLKVNVAEPIVIQAMLAKDEDEDESTKDDYWSKTGLVHIHFWGSDATKTQDMDMSYNKDTKVFSVTAPKIDGFKFMFWYGEDINQSASEAWRKTNDITNCTKNTCYSISYGTDKETPRTATPKTGLCTTDEYYVEITMKNGNTYKSNTISDDLSKEVSFFAPMDNDDTYMGGTVRIVHNGAVSNPITGFAAAGVYVAQIANASGFVANSIKPYTGNYYIRTDGAHGAWGDYKTDADNLMTSFTARAEKGETYSYYWVKNVAKNGDNNDGKTNVKADIANDYNDNLAGMIENDKFTDGGGFVYNSTNGANVRFSYEPTTNEFKRAILGGAGNNNFLNVYSKNGNLYADKEHQKQLSESADLNDSKFSDLSDWVYEKQVHVAADGKIASKVILKSVFNGQTTHLLGYQINPETGEETDTPKELEVMGEQSTGNYALRITYDFKKNRLIASWEPGEMEIKADQVIDSDVLFVQKEGADGTIDNTNVAQITYADDAHNAKLTSLKNMIYVLEVTDKIIYDTDADNQLYWICLPFDCRISDIFGVEGYVTLNAAGQATDGLWGIQRYDGTTRAQHGWFKEDNPEGFWRWMKRDETMKAGTGYVVVFDKTNASSWPSIDVEEVCTGTDGGCVDGKKMVKKRLKRLYFPSIGSKFTISYSGETANVVSYPDEPCNVTSPADRRADDSNWKVIGPVSYNNIGVDNTKSNNLTFYYTYDQSATKGQRYVEKAINAETNNELKSFHGYMTQFGGNLYWKPFTKSDDVTTPIAAPRYMENPDFQGGMLTIELRNAKGEELNHTFINLSKNGTTGFDQNLDLTKITENCAQIASVSEDVLYAGNTLPLDIEMVPLNVKVVANGTYDIALEQSLEGLEVRLYDAFEQTTTPLDLMSATVTLDKGEYKDRFFLQFVQKSPLTPTNFNGAIEQFNLPTDKTQKLLINDNIYLINAGRVYNASGTKVR